MANKLDVYSHMLVPFSVAAWCRGRKMHPASVNLSRGIRAMEEAKLALERAEASLEAAEREVVSLSGRVEQVMQEQGADRK